MTDHTPFDASAAVRNDAVWARTEPMKAALHLVLRLSFGGLPDDARILCVGVGTGAELLFLGEAFPRWRFTGVEPAAAMLQKCAESVEAAGLTERCTLHEGTVDTLPGALDFDAATSLLVSHFITDEDERTSYYRSIAKPLRPGGLFMEACIASDPTSREYEARLGPWTQMLREAGMPVEKMRQHLGDRIAVLPGSRICTLMEDAGFAPPTQMYQALLMHAWLSSATGNES